MARSRERELNPAYDPHYSEDAIRKAVEFLAVQQSCSLNSRRPVRDIAALGFMTALEEVTLTSCFEATDISPLAELPALRKLALGSPNCVHWNSHCRDYTPLARCPALRNLTLLGPFESFEPLAALRGLTCLSVRHENVFDQARMPRDITPLVRLPKLHFLQFGDDHGIWAQLPRDYFPLTEAPALRELVVTGCPPVEMEVAAIQAGLPPCDDLWLLPEPRALPPLRMIIAPFARHPRRADPLGIAIYHGPGEAAPADLGLREREARWVATWIGRHIAHRLRNPAWGEVTAGGRSRCLNFYLHSFESVGKFPIFIEAIREGMARLRNDWQHASFAIQLRVPPPKNTPAQEELLEKFRRERDEWEWEQQDRDKADYLERLHQLELKKQEGAPIIPEEFSPNERSPTPKPPWEDEDDEDDEQDDIAAADSDIATKQKPAPPSEWIDDAHPLCEQYLTSGVVHPGQVWFDHRAPDLAVQLMGREPDEEIPEDPKPAEA